VSDPAEERELLNSTPAGGRGGSLATIHAWLPGSEILVRSCLKQAQGMGTEAEMVRENDHGTDAKGPEGG